jgi:aminopeptidase
MRDSRVDALAQILVRYSTKVKKDDVCSIAASSAAEPLVQAVYEEVLRAGGLPIMQLQTSGAQAAFYDLASDEQLDWVPPTTEWTVENADVHISVMASLNTRELSQANPKKQARHQKAPKTATAGRSRCSRLTRTRARRACRCRPTRTSITPPAWSWTETR